MPITVSQDIDTQDLVTKIKELQVAVNAVNTATQAFAGAVDFNGLVTVDNIATFSIMPRIPINADLAGAGSVIGDAAPLSEGFTVITGANGTLGWLLPVAVAGAIVILKGTTAGVAKIWPRTGAQINAVGASTAMSLASGVIPVILIAKSSTQWYTLPLLPS